MLSSLTSWLHVVPIFFSCFPGNEAVLMMRLHLLQAIILFHQHNMPQCRRLLAQAEEEIKRLKVKDEDMSALMSLGKQACLLPIMI